MKYHITKAGEPGRCEAGVQACPLGGEHFDSEEKAYASIADKHETIPKPLTGVKVIEEFNSGGAFSISDLLGTIDPKDQEKKKEERKAAFEEKKKEKAFERLDPIAARQELIEKTQELNNERVSLASHTAKVTQTRLVNDLMEVIRRNNHDEILQTLKRLGTTDDSDTKSPSNVTPAAPAKAPVTPPPAAKPSLTTQANSKKLEEIQNEVNADLEKDPYVQHPTWGPIRESHKRWLDEQQNATKEAEKVFGPEEDSLGKVFEDAVSTVNARLKKDGDERSFSSRDLKAMLVAKLLKDL